MIQKHDMYPLRLLVQLLAHQKLYSTNWRAVMC